MTAIRRDTILGAPPDRVWSALMRPETLLAVSAPVLRLRPVDPPRFPDIWHPGDWLVSMRLFGLLPLGRQVISVSIEAADGPERVLRDNGHGALARRWDHRITIAPAGTGEGTAYRDEVIVEAGWLTPVVAGFARLFYAHRQRRWHSLIAADALPGAPDETATGPR